jgi:nucleoside-diphosphate-sugar epimerase
MSDHPTTPSPAALTAEPLIPEHLTLVRWLADGEHTVVTFADQKALSAVLSRLETLEATHARLREAAEQAERMLCHWQATHGVPASLPREAHELLRAALAAETPR